MARSYTIFWDNIAAQNSATVPQAQLVGAASIRPKIYDVFLGSPSTPAANAATWRFTRSTTASTGGTAVTPSPIDPGDPASISAAMVAPSMSAPTLGVVLMEWAQNQQATFRWVAAPAKEMIVPATASNGIVLMNPVLSSAFNITGTISFEE